MFGSVIVCLMDLEDEIGRRLIDIERQYLLPSSLQDFK
jgi:hypothetical protein